MQVCSVWTHGGDNARWRQDSHQTTRRGQFVTETTGRLIKDFKAIICDNKTLLQYKLDWLISMFDTKTVAFFEKAPSAFMEQTSVFIVSL